VSGVGSATPPESLKDRMTRELREALKAGERLRLSTLRMLSTAVKYREVELRRGLSDEEFVEVVGREAKRRREAVEAYRSAGREDRAETEDQERAVLEAYLPEGLSDAEVDTLIEEAVASTGASGPADMGKVMGLVMSRAKGRADGRVVQARVRDRLGPAG
jgi:uncharacterized protein YqeY